MSVHTAPQAFDMQNQSFFDLVAPIHLEYENALGALKVAYWIF